MSVVAERIRRIRRDLGMTQQEFAEALGAPEGQAMVSRWERGKATPSRMVRRRIEELSGEELVGLQEGTEGVISPSLARRLVHDAPGGDAVRRWILNTIENAILEADPETAAPDWLEGLRNGEP